MKIIRHSYGPSAMIYVPVILLLLVLGLRVDWVEAVVPPLMDLDFSATVNNTMVPWQETNGIEVTKAARVAIRHGFSEREKDITNLMSFRESSGGSQTVFVSSLVEYYLYEVRDWKINKASQGLWFESRIRKIDISDINAYPVTKFLASIDAVLKGRTGRLVVKSNPTDRGITIDGKDWGFTNKVFVVSAGDHFVTVAKKQPNLGCERKVNVPANTTQQFDCP